MQYRFNMTYDEGDFIAFMSAYIARSTGRVSIKLLNILSRLAGALMVVGGMANIVLSVYSTIRGGGATMSVLLPAIFITVVGIAIFYGKDTRHSGRMLWKNYDNKGGAVSYLFSPNEIKSHDRISDRKYQYSVICDIFEDDERYYLFVSAKEGLILRKDSSIPAEGFSDFITEKTGLKINKIKK